MIGVHFGGEEGLREQSLWSFELVLYREQRAGQQ